MYELPGGNNETEDATLLRTVIREADEETGLSITEIFQVSNTKRRREQAIQFNILVGVGAGAEVNVRLNPEELRTLAWVDKTGDLSHYPMMEKVISDALMAIEETAFDKHGSRRIGADLTSLVAAYRVTRLPSTGDANVVPCTENSKESSLVILFPILASVLANRHLNHTNF